MLIDIGANLSHSSFARDLDAVLDRAGAAGVKQIVVTGTSIEGSRQAVALAREHAEMLRATAGVHPHDASSCDGDTLQVLRELAGRPEVVALGECGLDFNRNYSPRPVQLAWFEAQVQLAAELGMPLFLHEREAHEALVEIIGRYRRQLPRAVVHCFTGTAAELRAYLDLDLHIGITGWICDERRGRHLRQVVKLIPPDRLMVETDAPFLVPRDLPADHVPQPHGRRNEPALLPHIVATIASCRGCSVGEVEAATTATATAFFDLDGA
jgi:TatD DNase family protein